MPLHPPIPYPSIGAHAAIGDRRTAALVAADGTLDWLCLPEYDGDIVFGALLDAHQGGFWRMGPAAHSLGRQSYFQETASAVTRWDANGTSLELTDLMTGPADDRPAEAKDQHVVLRRLRCLAGPVRCRLDLIPACNFRLGKASADSAGRASLRAGTHRLRLWTSQPLRVDSDAVEADFDLQTGEACWAVLANEGPDDEWSVERAEAVRAETEAYWQQWTNQLTYRGPNAPRVHLSARLVHLLTYAPAGSVIAAPTTSLPERIGGDWNADYRFAWVRDASLSVTILAALGNITDARRYLEWLCRLDSSTDAPLQVVYNVRGETKIKQREEKHCHGYRGSQPVRIGNHAYKQYQHDAFGYLMECAHLYLKAGGEWRPEFGDMIRRVADHLSTAWKDRDNSIWELGERRHYLSGKIMSWSALDCAIQIADRVGDNRGVDRWRAARAAVRAAILEKGWSESLGAFRQHFDADNLDAAALLVPLMGFLPPDDPRVKATVERIATDLTIDGFVYRFDPERTPGIPQPALPLGEYEGAFLPCTFWLASAYARMGQLDRSEAILQRAESVAGPLGLFAEAVDPRTGIFMGNSPLLFSQVEYVRAVRTLAEARAAG